jgi:hypothetical protein
LGRRFLKASIWPTSVLSTPLEGRYGSSPFVVEDGLERWLASQRSIEKSAAGN